MQVNIGVCREELVDALGLVRGEVVGDDVDLLAAGLVDHDVGEKRHELSRGVPLRGLAQHLAGPGIESGVQRQRAVAEVLEAVSLRASGRQRQYRVLAIESLDRRLLVHAEYRRMLWWVQI